VPTLTSSTRDGIYRRHKWYSLLGTNALWLINLILILVCMTQNQLPLFYSHTPSPTSTRTLVHIAQFINHGIFQEYDFGVLENRKVYGKAFPPKYSLSRTTVPVALVWGLNDAVVEPRVRKHIWTIKTTSFSGILSVFYSSLYKFRTWWG